MGEAPNGTGTSQAERAYLKNCANCGSFAITLPYRDSTGRTFCSEYCLEWAMQPRTFCPKCLADTTSDSLDGLTSVNGIGFALRGNADKCPMCRSVVRRTWFTLFYVPVIPLRRYRVIHSRPHAFFNRRLRDQV